jgi:hypothetical protein
MFEQEARKPGTDIDLKTRHDPEPSIQKPKSHEQTDLEQLLSGSRIKRSAAPLLASWLLNSS